jgi:hypothetical protein
MHKRIKSAFKRVEFVCDRLSYTVLSGRWCHIIILKVYVPTEDKTDHVKDSFYQELERVFDKFPNQHIKILLADFNAKVGREDIFNPTIGNKSLQEISNDNGVRVVNFATSKNLTVKSTMFQHRSIHKYTWTSPDGKTHNQGSRLCTDYYLVAVEKVRERLAVNKQRSQRFDMERFNLNKLNDVEGKEQFCVEVSNRFSALEDLDAEVEINSTWETIRENINISAKESLGYFEFKKHKPWFDKGCSKLLDQRKQAKWLQDQSEINRDNLNNVRHEASRQFRNKKREYLKGKINELVTNSKNKNIRDLYREINEFKRG